MGSDAVQVAKESVDAWNNADWERFRELTSPDVIGFEPATGREIHGIEGNLELGKGWKSAFPDAHGEVNNAFGSGENACIEITYRGTHTGDMVGPTGTIPATGRPTTLAAALICQVRDGKITRVTQYFDLMGMLSQLGVLPAGAETGSATSAVR